MRFPEFSGEWETYIIADILCIGNGRDYKQLSKGDIPVFGTGGYMTSVNECLYEGETTFIGRKGTINKPFYYNGKFWTVDTLFYTHSFKRVIPKFVYCLFQTINWLRYNEASGVPSLSKDTIEKIKVRIPQLDEQKKIAKLLSLLEERIATQNKIIEKYESLIKGIAQHCIKAASGITYVKLGDICQITTGKLDANAQVDNGIYPFFTCAEKPFKIDNFAFDTEALLISGNGANLGYINYYKGKFNAYQRTYVLDLFSENIQYIKWALKVLLPKRIATEKSLSNTPYIVLSTLTDLRLPLPCKSEQSFIANLMQSLEEILSNQIAQYDSYNYLKQYLLRQMFI
ncbi:MAG: restriction endonuclease subunit S [Candidatus Aphodosoma sp.]|nr:restriction endonuclease subunit S [Candidatus Aphodosoma sp.]